MTDEKTQKIRVVYYDASLESYNKLVDDFGDDPYMPIQHLDENGNSTWKFTGIVFVYKNNTIYKPGDYYYIEINDGDKE